MLPQLPGPYLGSVLLDNICTEKDICPAPSSWAMHALAHLNKHTLYPAPLLWLALYLGEKQQQLKNLSLRLIPWFSICHIQENVRLIWPHCPKRGGRGICLDQLKPVFAEPRRSSRNATTNTHSGFMAENCSTISVTQIHIQDSITVPLGGNRDGLGRQQPLKTGMIICRFFHSYHLSLIWKLNAYVPSLTILSANFTV